MKGKGKGQGKNRDIHGRASGQSPNTPKNPAGTRPHRPIPTSARPCVKCGSRDHESGKCPKNQEHRSYMAQAMNFTASCLGSDEMHSATTEAFGCGNLARGRALLDCGATDMVGSVEAIEAILDISQEAFGADHDWVSVDTDDRPVYMCGDARRKQALSKVKVKVQPGRHVTHLHVHAQETELVVCKSLSAQGAGINFETGQAVFRNLEPETVVQLERRWTGHLWMDLFEQMPLISDNPLSLSDNCSKNKNWWDIARFKNASACSTHLRPDQRTRLTLLTLRQCDGRGFSLRNLDHQSHSSMSRSLLM